MYFSWFYCCDVVSLECRNDIFVNKYKNPMGNTFN